MEEQVTTPVVPPLKLLSVDASQNLPYETTSTLGPFCQGQAHHVSPHPEPDTCTYGAGFPVGKASGATRG